ncbi:unnamed protein product [Meganyctiphanes norvegica]|uniref:Acireductone dioxygenase n=1 Tax=Meganyctiphanes norvegica TaxID=48144 RepID=A0AAV2RB92_MEGNR
MVQLWYMDSSSEDQRLQHHRTPQQFADLDQIKKETGVLYWKIDPNSEDGEAALAKLKSDRGYNYEDVMEVSKNTLQNYEEKIKSFFKEHIHTDEEIRYIVDGSGYFDVRDASDRWVRIQMGPGDLVVLPAGIYHRFALDTNNYIKAKRFFVGEPVWTPHNRPVDDMEARKDYVQKQKNKKLTEE